MVMLGVTLTVVSGAESTLKVGVYYYFNIFPNFLPISKSGGATKSRPIDPLDNPPFFVHLLP